MSDKQALLAAVNALVTSPDAKRLYGVLADAIPLCRREPLEFTGDASLVNPLLQLAVRDVERYDAVMSLVDNKREAAGQPPLVQRVDEDGYDKKTYMREFMRAKRERERRAVEIENLMRPEKDKLTGTARLDFMQRQVDRWSTQRDAALAAAKRANGGRLTRQQWAETIAAAWQKVDRELDELEELARAELRKK